MSPDYSGMFLTLDTTNGVDRHQLVGAKEKRQKTLKPAGQ